MTVQVEIFGVRHHGPGSAHALERALDALDPAVVLIEGPPEADGLVALAGSEAMRPPLALLIYATDEPAVASFVPFAEFSPEWLAMRWAVRRGRPVRFIDLPYAVGIAERLRAPEADVSPEPVEIDPLVRDPLSALAEAAGWDDGEAWWNAVVEQAASAPAVFDAVETAMTALRAAAEGRADPNAEREAKREAWMRLAIAEAAQAGEGPIAVVVGAWHVPALRQKVPLGQDRSLVRGLSRAKTSATWTPWTDAKLAAASGYGAGVVSPGWYGAVWRELRRGGGEPLDLRRLTADWQSRAAGLLREAGTPVSTASVIEAARLAESLAALRDRQVPGLQEMRDASLAVICGGEPAPLALIEARLIIGTRVGEVDPDAPQTPLQADLSRQQRRLRLKPEALALEAALDLRTEAGLDKSILFNRLALIGIHWAKPLDPGGSRGTFRERWVLEWTPGLSIALVEALVWGTTVADAAAARALAQARDSRDLATLSELVRQCLLAGLQEAAEQAMDRLQAMAVDSVDVAPLMDAAPPLVQVLRYGAAREVPEAPLRRLVHTLTEQICVGLAVASRSLDADAAAAMNQRILIFDRALTLFEDEVLAGDWMAALARVLADSQAAAMVRGAAARRLHERGAAPAAETARTLSLALSPAQPAPEAAAWLEGFLGGDGELLLHDHALFAVIDDFVVGLPVESFELLLPAFRRAFSGLDSYQRRRLLDLSGTPSGAARPAPTPMAVDNPAFDRSLPLLKLILGLDA